MLPFHMRQKSYLLVCECIGVEARVAELKYVPRCLEYKQGN